MTTFTNGNPCEFQKEPLMGTLRKTVLLSQPLSKQLPYKTQATLALSALLFLSGCSTLPTDYTPKNPSNPSAKNSIDNTSRSSHSPKQAVPTAQTLQSGKGITAADHRVLDDKIHYHPIIWDEMQGQFHLAASHLGRYDSHLAYFHKNPNYLNQVTKRSKPYLHFILSEVQKRDMPYEMALLPIVESSFKATAKSSQSAVGLWQFIPSTGQMYGLDQNWWYDGRQDTVQSTQAALDYLKKLYTLNNNDWLLALASYNAGIGNVYKAIKKYKQQKNAKTTPTFWDIQHLLPKETQNYVPQLLAVSHTINHAENWGIELEPVNNSPFFTEIELGKQITLSEAAQISGVTEEMFSLLNPGYLRPTTPPEGPFNILLPIEYAEKFKLRLAEENSLFDIQWMQHKIKPGDSLGAIAQKYHTSTTAIRTLNGLKNNVIQSGKTLLIPVPSQLAANVQRPLKEIYTGAKKIHTVSSGDSLWRLSSYYNVDIKTLCQWNNIDINTPLLKGQRLEIHSPDYHKQITHTLKRGESLWTLAQKYNVSTDSLARWNNLKQSNMIQPGTQLAIWLPKPPKKQHKNYQVKNGDSLWVIAKANQLSTQQLASYNQLSIKAYLKPGQILKIPLES